jgi:hypothetical protein
MNSRRPYNYYRKLIKYILVQLDDEYLAHRINNPLENAAAKFQFDENEPLLYENFLKLTGAFIGHIYLKGYGVRRQLTEQQSTIEAITLLETGYQGHLQDRIDHAFLDAQEFGLSYLFSYFISFITSSARQNHINCVFKHNLNTLGWTEKIRIVRLLFRDWKRFLPSSMKDSPPENYANQLPELFKTINDVNGQTRQYFHKESNQIPNFSEF